MKFTLALVSSMALSASAFVAPRAAFSRVNMAMPATLAEVQEIAAEQLGVEASEVKAESTFQDLGADSLDQVELVMAIEEKFDVEIDDEVAGTMASVQDVLDFLEK